jgi:hypothetical protein
MKYLLLKNIAFTTYSIVGGDKTNRVATYAKPFR